MMSPISIQFIMPMVILSFMMNLVLKDHLLLKKISRTVSILKNQMALDNITLLKMESLSNNFLLKKLQE